MNVKDVIEDVMIATGVSVSLVDIQQILSVVLLIFNVIWICIKSGVKIYHHIKDKRYDQIDDTVKDAIDNIEKITNQDKKNDSTGK